MHHLAQVNMGRLAAPLDSEQLAAFVEALDPVNASADGAPGFVWRLQTDEGNATDVSGFQFDAVDGAEVILNMSVWTGIEPLAAWVFGDLHREILRRRREFFQRMTEATSALWWVPAGHLPSVAEAEERLLLLRRVGPSPDAFTFRHAFGPPDGGEGAGDAARVESDDGWMCPA